MSHIATLIESYGLLAVFLSLFLEGAGLPLPSYPVLMLAAALAPQTNYTWPEIFLTGLLAMMIADFGWLGAGRRYGTHVIKLLCRISLAPDSCVRRTGEVFGKIGPAILLFAKFVPGFTNISIVLAGVMRVPVLVFALLDGIGVSLYVGLGVLLGTLFRDAITDMLAILTKIGQGGALLVVAAFGLFLFRKWMQRQRLIRQLRMDRITIDELRQLINDGAQPIILDVRPHQLRVVEGIIPGSIHAYASELDSAINEIDLNSEVIIYCSCPNEASAAEAALHLKKMGFTKMRPLLGGIDAWVQSGQALEFLPVVA